jgi:RNAse (barnase) inhibitor barstar
MGKFKYKLKELEVGDVDYNKGTKSTVTDIDPETGRITWDIQEVPDFESVFRNLKKAKEFMDKLSKTKDVRQDSVMQKIQQQLTTTFNELRTHVRKNYPEDYARIKMVAETNTISSNSGFISGGEGENHTGPSPRKSTYGAYTQAGFKKVNEGPGATFGPGPSAGPEGVKDNVYVKDFKYKLVNQKALNKKAKGIEVKQLWEATDTEDFLNGMNIVDPDRRQFISSRLEGFDTVEEKLNALIPLLQSAKHETMDYYRANPNSFAVVYGTDLANDYLNDLIDLFKKQ